MTDSKPKTRRRPEKIDDEGLTLKQRKLADEWLKGSSQSEAARLAGYRGNVATLAVIGCRELKKAKVAAYVKKRLSEAAMDVDEVLWRLTRLAQGTLEDFITLRGKAYEIDLKKAKQLGKLGLLKSLKPTRFGTEIELYSPADALVQLGKYHHLFTDVRIRTWRDDVIDLLKAGKTTPEQVLQELGAEIATELIAAAGLRRDENGEAQAASPD